MGKIIALIGCCVFAILLGAAVWQQSVHDSKINDADSKLAAATLLEDATARGVATGELMKQFVATGDAALLPQIQENTDSGVKTLTAALSQAGGDPNEFLAQGAQMVEASGRIIALRQAGDVEGAALALNSLAPQFEAFITAQKEAIAAQRADAASLQDSADSAGSVSTWLAVGAALVGSALLVGASVVIARRLARRRAVSTATPV